MEKITNPHQAQDHFVLPENDKPLKEANIKLTTEQIEFFKTNGYLSIDHLIDEDEVTYIRQQYDQVNRIKNTFQPKRKKSILFSFE